MNIGNTSNPAQDTDDQTNAVRVDQVALAELREWGKLGLRFAEDFRGQEKQLEEVVAVCGEVDASVKRLLGIPESVSLGLVDERRMKSALREMGVEIPLTNDIIGAASQTFIKCLAALGDTNDSKSLEKMGINVIKLKGVLLEPGKMRQGDPTGNSTRTFNAYKTMPRLEMILAMLQNEGVYTEDIIVCQGDVYPNQMRHLPYYVVEIPRLNRQMLICDEVGEQTFIIDGIMNRERLCEVTKAELEEKFGERVMPIPCHNRGQYISDVSIALFFDFSDMTTRNQVKPKVKVIDQELVRDEMLKLYPTSKDFFEAIAGWGRRDISVWGKKMTAIVGIFGMNGMDNPEMYKLAERIYGTDDALVQKNMTTLERGSDKEKWSKLIKKMYPKMSDFIAMDFAKRKAFEIDGKKLPAITTMFIGQQVASYAELSLYRMALEIYGFEDIETRAKVEAYIENEEKLLELGRDKNKWAAEVKAQFPTLKDFIEKNVDHTGRETIDVLGNKLAFLAGIFEIKDNVSSIAGFYKLAKAIYGSENPELQVEMDRYIKNEERRKNLGKDREKWKEEIKMVYPTLQSFLENNTADKKEAMEVAGVSIGGLGILFGFKKAASTADFYRLAKEIYQPDEESDDGRFLKVVTENADRVDSLGKDRGKWTAEIKKVYPTYGDFVAMKGMARRDVEIAGKKLSFIGSIFGMKRAVSSNEGFYEIAEKIYYPNGR